MKALIGLRTNSWSEDEQRLYSHLSSVEKYSICVVFHNRPAEVKLPCPVVDIDNKWISKHGLRAVRGWGWRCGDYFLYAMREAFPSFDYYWLIEPDVFFFGSVPEFFSIFEGVESDFLGTYIHSVERNSIWGRGMPDMPLWATIFALTRFSARAIDSLFLLRQAYSKSEIPERTFSNDEVFCMSHLMSASDMKCLAISEIAPVWLPEGSFATDPDRLIEEIEAKGVKGVYHPARCRDSFIHAVAARAAGNTGFFVECDPLSLYFLMRKSQRLRGKLLFESRLP